MKTREEVVRELTDSHFDIEDGLVSIYWFPAGPEDEIRLLEVNRNSESCASVAPIRFTQSREVPYFCVIADVTPDELKAIQGGTLDLPAEWGNDLKGTVEFTRRSKTA